MNSMMRRIITNTLLAGTSLVFSVCIVFILLEIFVRIYHPASVSPGYTITNERRRYELRPGFSGKTYQVPLFINSHGFREKEREILKNAYRIAVLGDSVTFGIGVDAEKTFPGVLETKLRETYHGSPEIQVFNLGIPSYNTVMEYRYLEDVYEKLKPDLVIVQFTAGNDTALTELNSLEVNRFAFFRKIKDMLRYLQSYNFLAARFYSLKFRLFSRNYVNQALARVDFDQAAYNDDFQGWKEAVKAFSDFREFCRQKNCRLLFAVFVNNINLTAEKAADPMKKTSDRIFSALDSLEISSVFLDDGFRKYAGSEKKLWVTPADSHFSVSAHELSAAMLFDRIVSEKMIP